MAKSKAALAPGACSALERICRHCDNWSEARMRCDHAPLEPCPPECTCDAWTPLEERKMKCPHCGFGLLWSEDRGAHCDGCDDFDPETDLPNPSPEPRRQGGDL